MSSHAFVLGSLGLALALSGRRPGPPTRVGTERATRGEAGPDQSGQFTLRGSRDVATRLSAVALGVAVTIVVGGFAGIAAGLTTAAGADYGLRKLEPAEMRRTRESRAEELPLVLDLLGICLQAGMPLVAALETVAQARPGPFSRDLAVVAGLQRLGSTPADAWAELVGDADLSPVARAVTRSAESGSRLAAAFERMAAERRSSLTARAAARAQRAGVTAMAPLGLCFLPAFVSLGVVPIVLALAQEVLP